MWVGMGVSVWVDMGVSVWVCVGGYGCVLQLCGHSDLIKKSSPPPPPKIQSLSVEYFMKVPLNSV